MCFLSAMREEKNRGRHKAPEREMGWEEKTLVSLIFMTSMFHPRVKALAMYNVSMLNIKVQ